MSFKKKHLKPVLITSGIFMIILGILLYFYVKDPERNYLYIDTTEKIDILLAKQDIGVGELITKENIYSKTVDKESILSLDNIYLNPKEILGKKALYPINTNQYLYDNYFISEDEWLKNRVRYPIEVSILGTVANSVKKGDYVDLLVVYDDDKYNKNTTIKTRFDSKPINYDIVVPKLLIEGLKDSNGKKIETGKSEGIVPAYAIVYLTHEELDRYLDSTKKGETAMTIYDDTSVPPNTPTYSMEAYEKNVNKEEIKNGNKENE